MKKFQWWIAGGLTLILVLLLVFGRSTKNGEKIAIEKVATHTITETVTASGNIYPETEVKIAPEVSGEITQLTIKEGDSVVAGQVLVRINAAIYNSMVNQASATVNQSKAGVSNAQEMVAQAQSQYDLSRATYNRNKQLLKDKYISRMEFEQAEAQFKSAQATYEAARASAGGGRYGVEGAQAGLTQARENLRKTTITAPTSGIISKLNVKEGERVVGTAQMAGTEILTIADMSRIEVRVDVSETDIAKVKPGDTAYVEAGAYRGRKFPGVVSKVGVSSKTSSALGQATSSDQVSNYVVHILILPSGYAELAAKLGKGQFVFKPGMSAFVEIITKKETNILSVPVVAVSTRDWPDSVKKQQEQVDDMNAETIRQIVFVKKAEADEVEMRDVTTGIQDNNYIQILSGLKINEEVVIAPYRSITRLLKDKDKIIVVKKEDLYDEKEAE